MYAKLCTTIALYHQFSMRSAIVVHRWKVRMQEHNLRSESSHESQSQTYSKLDESYSQSRSASNLSN